MQRICAGVRVGGAIWWGPNLQRLQAGGPAVHHRHHHRHHHAAALTAPFARAPRLAALCATSLLRGSVVASTSVSGGGSSSSSSSSYSLGSNRRIATSATGAGAPTYPNSGSTAAPTASNGSESSNSNGSASSSSITTNTSSGGEGGRVPVSELRLAAQLSRLSGLAYKDERELRARLDAENFKLVACGATRFTRWYIADGRLLPGGEEEGGGGEAGTSSSSSVGSSHDEGKGGGNGSGSSSSGGFPARVVLVRGVVWRSQEVEIARLWQDLARCWPTPFLPELTTPPRSVVAHAGISGMAERLWGDIEPYVGARPEGARLYFSGHSLGGALSTLLCGMARLRVRVPQPDVRTFTFGSPPTLAPARGGPPAAVLHALGLGDDALQHYVLDNDPIPRALLAVDPTLALARRWPGVGALLEWQERAAAGLSGLAGMAQQLTSLTGISFGGGGGNSGSTGSGGGGDGGGEGGGGGLGGLAGGTPARFLFDVVGDVNLIRWAPPGAAAAAAAAAAATSSVPAGGSPSSSGSSSSATMEAISSQVGQPSSSPAATPPQTTSVPFYNDRVRRLGPSELQQQLELAVSELLAAPTKALQALVDHHHAAYTAELIAAARHLARQQQKQRQQQQQDQEQEQVEEQSDRRVA